MPFMLALSAEHVAYRTQYDITAALRIRIVRITVIMVPFIYRLLAVNSGSAVPKGGRCCCLPPTPCRIGGIPFVYLLQRFIVKKTDKLFHTRRSALELLCNVVAADFTTPHHGNVAKEAKMRERQILAALRKASKPKLYSSLQSAALMLGRRHKRPPLLCDLHTQATDSENRAGGLGSTTGVPAERLLSSFEGFGLEDKDEIDMTFDGNLEDGGTTSSGRGAGVCGVAVRRAPPG
ncbi:LOW QUALITY PROTEIN: hypothetical protein Q4I30_005932 [Leishmania utingensis]|uniref:Uncharacterized protein n=1 Tax=Leishmania utingensis TaxID=653362 RepID=A0AAW3A4W2_9TRYP